MILQPAQNYHDSRKYWWLPRPSKLFNSNYILLFPLNHLVLCKLSCYEKPILSAPVDRVQYILQLGWTVVESTIYNLKH